MEKQFIYTVKRLHIRLRSLVEFGPNTLERIYSSHKFPPIDKLDTNGESKVRQYRKRPVQANESTPRIHLESPCPDKKYSGRKIRPITINGVAYSSHRQAMTQLGVNKEKLLALYLEGKPKHIGPFYLNDTLYRSVSEASLQERISFFEIVVELSKYLEAQQKASEPK